MTRREFTKLIAKLINQMNDDGVEPILDYVLRSSYEQERLFEAGFSKCDGTTKKSAHQFGKAADIYFVWDNVPDYGFVRQESKDAAKKYHELWVSWGGKPVIEWDKCHYEAP